MLSEIPHLLCGLQMGFRYHLNALGARSFDAYC